MSADLPSSSAIAEKLSPTAARPGLPPFFAVSLAKLAIMSFCTMGLYQVYWFYAHWRYVRVWNTGRDFSPARRTAMFFLYCYPLFRRVRNLDRQLNGHSRLQAGLLTLGFIAVNLLDILPGLWSLLSIFSFAFLLPVQSRANQLNEQCYASPFDRNDSLSVWNWIVLVLGSLLVVLNVVAAISELGK